jgi:hypothetical protein
MGWTFAIIYCVICFTACFFMGRAAWGMRKERKDYEQQLKKLRENTEFMARELNVIRNNGCRDRWQ